MAVTAFNKTLLKRLKKQVAAARVKEKAARNKLRLALLKVKKITLAYENKLDKKTKETKAKVAAAESAVYSKLVKSMQKKATKNRKKRL